MNTFVIGDVHGHASLLKALYGKAGITDERVIQIGDLGHFGYASRDGDLDCYRFARKTGMHLLWGNHDRATISSVHTFTGYVRPYFETIDIIKHMMIEDYFHLALEVDGWLLTHAGLGEFKDLGKRFGHDVDAIVNWINQGGTIVNAIGQERGGLSSLGGILWRDDYAESLYDGVPQIFGHTASRTGKINGEKDRWWNIDIGVKEHQKLAGIWLPSQEIVEVEL